MTTATDILNRINEAKTAINKVISQVEAGEEVNLTMVSLDIEFITQEIAKLPSDQADPVKDPLMNLLSQVDVVYDKMKAHHEEIKQKLGKVNTSSKATKAYKGDTE